MWGNSRLFKQLIHEVPACRTFSPQDDFFISQISDSNICLCGEPVTYGQYYNEIFSAKGDETDICALFDFEANSHLVPKIKEALNEIQRPCLIHFYHNVRVKLVEVVDQ